MTRAILLDFETRPDPAIMDSPEYWAWYRDRLSPDGRLKDPVKIAEDLTRKEDEHRKEFALKPYLGLIVCVGIMAYEDEAPTVLCADAATRQCEAQVLRQLQGFLQGVGGQPTVLGWNIKRFDLPFVIGRSLVQGIPVDLPKPRDYRRVFDLKDDTGLEGSLSVWQFAMGGGFKEVEGEDLLALPLPDLAEHCRQDMLATLSLAQRTEHLWGGRS